MEFKIFATLIFLLIALYWDIRYCRIDNRISMGFAAAGVLTNLVLKGHEGLVASVVGWILPVGILFIFFLLKMLGAGDIKLFGAIGAVWGSSFVIHCMMYSFLLGGIIGVLLLILRKNARYRLKHLFEYFKMCFFTVRLQEYNEFLDKTDGGTFRFSYAIVPATVIQMVIAIMVV